MIHSSHRRRPVPNAELALDSGVRRNDDRMEHFTTL
jgi:hypothetical protein